MEISQLDAPELKKKQKKTQKWLKVVTQGFDEVVFQTHQQKRYIVKVFT